MANLFWLAFGVIYIDLAINQHDIQSESLIVLLIEPIKKMANFYLLNLLSFYILIWS